ncbi:multicopper oxidase family protein [Deinococcus malanensis]|uniref:multicopper oxidase family protein n=1 Tax=Deinococcus malanensis TaxID=1706855 RepID=UPI00363E5191
MRLTLRNTFDQPHTIHPHGIISVAQRMDGLDEVLPGQSFIYEFVATEAGTFAYHCHFQTNLHLNMGMYGALIVEPADSKARVWKSEHTLILDDWDSRQDPNNPVHRPKANYFLVNGKAAPLIPDLQIPPGDVSLLRMINMGYTQHSMHLHGVTFLVMAKDGHDLPQPYEADTLLIAPGERYDLLVKGRDGRFVFHDHTGPHATNDGVYPGAFTSWSTAARRWTSTAGRTHRRPRPVTITGLLLAPACRFWMTGTHRSCAQRASNSVREKCV